MLKLPNPILDRFNLPIEKEQVVNAVLTHEWVNAIRKHFKNGATH